MAGSIVTPVERIKRLAARSALRVAEVPEKKDQSTHLAGLLRLLVVKRVTGVKNLKRGKRMKNFKLIVENWNAFIKEDDDLIEEDIEYYHILDATYDDGTIAEDVEFGTMSLKRLNIAAARSSSINQ